MTDTAAWAALLRVHARVVPRLDRELRERCGLPITWYDVLLELNGAPDRRLAMGELGELAVVSRTRATRVVDELAAAGLVERIPHAEDRRSTIVALTTAGRQRFRRAAPFYVRGIERHFTRHLGADAQAVARALERVLKAEQDAASLAAERLSRADGQRRGRPEPHAEGREPG